MPNNNLYVPLSMHVLLVGENGDQQYKYTDLTPRYDVMYGTSLGENIESDLFSTRGGMGKGAHIHWKLPDGLTTGKILEDGEIELPAVPDRWIVTRLWTNIKEQSPDIYSKSWMVESNVLTERKSKTDLTNAQSCKYPYLKINDKGIFENDKWGEPFRYIGRSYEYGKNVPKAEKSINKLTAMAPGNALFASDYRACKNVFGFYDSLEDIKTDGEVNFSITYCVYGWYSETENDVLNQVTSAEECVNMYGWKPTGKLSFPAHTICEGVCYNVEWTGEETNYIPEDLRYVIDSNMAVGNTSKEAIAALSQFKNPTENSNDTVQEHILNLIANRSAMLTESASNLLYAEDNLHKYRFGYVDSIKKVRLRKKSKDELNKESKDETCSLQNLKHLVNDINTQYQNYFDTSIVLEREKESVYDCWYQLAKVYSTSDDLDDFDDDDDTSALDQKREQVEKSCKQSVNELALEIRKHKKELTDILENINTLYSQFTQSANDMYELAEISQQRYWTPNNPVLLFADVPRDYLQGEDGILSEDNVLACRVDGQFMTSVTISVNDGSGEKEYTILAEELLKETLPAESAEAIREAVLIATDFSVNMAAHLEKENSSLTNISVQDIAKKIREKQLNALSHADDYAYLGEEKTLKTMHEKIGLDGMYPSLMGTIPWREPWNPMYLVWDVKFYVDKEVLGAEPNLKNWKLQDEDFVYIGNAKEDFENMPMISNTGKTLLTPAVAYDFAEGVYALTNNSELSKKVQRMNVLSQSLGNFNNQLLMKQNHIQLPIFVDDYVEWNEDTISILPLIRELTEGLAAEDPIFDQYHCPIRAGFMTIERIKVVDCFGQTQQPIIDGVAVSEALRSGDENFTNVIMLPPRLVQPSRLHFQWTCPDFSKPCMDGTDENPICGWIIPNHFDQTIMVFSGDGEYYGCVQSSYVDEHSIVWCAAPGQSQTGIPSDNINQELRKFIEALINKGVSDNPETGIFKQLLEVIDSSLWSINSLKQKQLTGMSFYVGKPLAIVSATLKLELLGNAVKYKTAFGAEAEENSNPDVNVNKAKFQVEIGRIKNPEDGVIGFFENGNYDTLHITSKNIETTDLNESYFTKNNQIIVQSDPAIDATKLTIIMEPSGTVDIVSGILPVKQMSLNPNMISKMINKLYLTVFMGPILTDKSQLTIPHSDLPGKQWSYVTVNTEGKTEEQFGIAQTSEKAYYPKSINMAKDGWLKLNNRK